MPQETIRPCGINPRSDIDVQIVGLVLPCPGAQGAQQFHRRTAAPGLGMHVKQLHGGGAGGRKVVLAQHDDGHADRNAVMLGDQQAGIAALQTATTDLLHTGIVQRQGPVQAFTMEQVPQRDHGGDIRLITGQPHVHPSRFGRCSLGMHISVHLRPSSELPATFALRVSPFSFFLPQMHTRVKILIEK
uniref:Uncharacterized protein n=1 Tax=Magnetospirillum gryphiswaldense TaxID=55518 RepID=Q3BK94_9PROT|nr:hypothetical protein mgI512 [Magnetospirillum gryphiswaldense MSR-1]